MVEDTLEVWGQNLLFLGPLLSRNFTSLELPSKGGHCCFKLKTFGVYSTYGLFAGQYFNPFQFFKICILHCLWYFAVLYVFFSSLFIVKILLKCQDVLLSKKTMLTAGYILFIRLISQLYFVYFKVIYCFPHSNNCEGGGLDQEREANSKMLSKPKGGI